VSGGADITRRDVVVAVALAFLAAALTVAIPVALAIMIGSPA
jgi:hypothetical protein